MAFAYHIKLWDLSKPLFPVYDGKYQWNGDLTLQNIQSDIHITCIVLISPNVNSRWVSYVITLFIICVLNDINGLFTLQWRHNGFDIVPNHQPQDCVLNRLFRRRSKKTSNLRVTFLFCGEFTDGQMASSAENGSISWRHHESPVCSSNFFFKCSDRSTSNRWYL